MGVLVSLFLVFMVVLTLLLGLSIGVAFLLNWMLPGVGLEMALLVAVIAVGQAILIFGRVLNALPPTPAEIEGESQPPIVILDQELTLPRRRRKRSP
jgi:hypothetical protein